MKPGPLIYATIEIGDSNITVPSKTVSSSYLRRFASFCAGICRGVLNDCLG